MADEKVNMGPEENKPPETLSPPGQGDLPPLEENNAPAVSDEGKAAPDHVEPDSPSADKHTHVTTVDTAASTSDMNNIAFRLCAMGYQSIHVTSQRTGNNETKAYPTIRICLLITLTGDCLSRNAQTSYAKCPLWVINPKPSKGKGDDAEYPIRQRSSHSSPVGSNDSHGIYPVFQTKENSYCIPKLKFD